MATALETIDKFAACLISEHEANDALAKIDVHGAFTLEPKGAQDWIVRFCGYDYNRQIWIKVEVG